MSADLDLPEAALLRLETARLGPDVAYARAHDIDLRAAEACAGLLTVNGIRPRPDGTFDFDEDGIEGAVIEALGEDAESIHDLVAWPLDAPHRWRCWGGTAGGLGTAAAVNAATYFDGAPLRVFRSPLRWLQAGGVGFVPLDRRWAMRFLLETSPMADVLAAEDDAHAAELVAARHALVDEQHIVVPAVLGRAA